MSDNINKFLQSHPAAKNNWIRAVAVTQELNAKSARQLRRDMARFALASASAIFFIYAVTLAWHS
jgi:hypothetical protein